MGATWSRTVGQADRVFLHGEVQASDRFYFTPLNDTLESRSRRWAVSLFGRNLTNERTLIATASSSPVAISGHPGEARSLGLEFSVFSIGR